MPKRKKIFILDTNVILHDSSCIYHFEEHDIIIPIPVLEELDQFKKGSQIINYHARQFVRDLDKLSADKLFNGNMTLGEGKGILAIRLDKEIEQDGELTGKDYSPPTPLYPNEFLVLRNGKKSALATCIAGEMANDYTIKRVNKESVYGITPRNAEQTFAVHALLNPDVKLVTISGKAGTGKTLLALAAALETRTKYRQILLARPIVPLSNKDIGYLPGDIPSKLKPYMQPLYDNLGVIRGQFAEKSEMNQRLQLMLDEETKIVFTGDINQIDHPYLGIYSNGLSALIDKMQGQRLYAHIDLRKGERSELAELASDIL